MDLVLTPQEATGYLTRSVIAVLDKSLEAPSFFSSYFREETADTLGLEVQVRRNKQMIAVDVPRGSVGNLNEFDQGSSKLFIPPYYREYIVMNSLRHYYRVFGTNNVSSADVAGLTKEILKYVRAMIAKIKRSYELQAAQVFEDGIVTLVSGENINYGRLNSSKFDFSSSTWATGTNNPLAHFQQAADHIREKGQTNAAMFDIILGGLALTALLGNETFQKSADIKDINLQDIKAPQATATGGAYHGTISFGGYRGRLWSSSATYVAANGTNTPYMNPKKFSMIAEGAEMVMGFAAVPQVIPIGEGNQTIKTGAFVTDDYIDKAQSAHIFDVKSAGLAIPVAVDELFTGQVLP